MKKALLLVILMTLLVWANSALAIFSDVPVNHPNAKAIEFVRDQNIIDGYSDGTFRPSENINFAEAAKIIVNSFDIPAETSDPWFKSFIESLAQNNAIPPTVKEPTALLTRGEMAEIISGIFQNLPKN